MIKICQDWLHRASQGLFQVCLGDGQTQEHDHQAIDLEEDCGENDQDAEASEEHHGGLEDAKGCDGAFGK